MRRLVPVALLVVSALYFAAFVHYGVNLEDEGLLLHQIARTVRGELPYVDFHTGYTPGGFYLNAWLQETFGASVLPLRWMLVGINTVTVLTLYGLALPFAGVALSAAMALGYAAFLPCFVGEFASFNVPYPAWYAALGFLAVQGAMDRWLRTQAASALFVAGLAAGVTFAFKPNLGILAALACGITLAVLSSGDDDVDRRGGRLLLWLAAAAFVVLFNFRVIGGEFPVIVGPAYVLVLGRLRWARGTATHRQRLWPAVALVAAGGLVPTLPWAAFFLQRLGLSAFLREVLLLGSDADRIYSTPYPVPLGFPAAWALLAAVGLAVVGWLGLLAERGRVRVGRAASAVVALGGLTIVLVASWARMPEGVARSIFWQAQHVGFFAAPLLLIAVSVVVLRRLRPGAAALTVGNRRVVGALAFALCMFVALYPRVDTMHLVGALPSVLVLAAAAGARMAAAWAPVLGWRAGTVRGAMALGAAALAAIAVGPNFEGLLHVAGGMPTRRPMVTLASDAAAVQVERERAEDVRALNDLLAFLRGHLRPEEKIFTFPAVALVPYALQRSTPTPHDYFFPGRPDHRDEAEILRTLNAEPPRYIVTLNRRFGFFSEAPAYYFLLREWIRGHYGVAARFGRYDILAYGWPAAQRPEEGGPYAAPVTEWEPSRLMGELADPDRERRRAAILEFLRRAGSSAGVGPLAQQWAPTESQLLLLVRNLGEVGERLPMADLIAWLDAGGRVGNEAAGALSNITLRDAADRYALSGAARPAEDLAGFLDGVEIPRELLRSWLTDWKQRRRVGIFAAYALAAAGDQPAIPLLEAVVREEPKRYFLKLMAARSLVHLGRPEYLCELTDLLGKQSHEVQDTVPSYLIDYAATHPDAVAACLKRSLRDPDPLGREASAWIAGTARLQGVETELRAALDDGKPPVRMAAAWALGRLRDTGARAALTPLVDGPDHELGAFAREALGRIDGAER